MSPPELVFAQAEGQNAFFTELAEALISEVEKLGARGRVAMGGFPDAGRGSVTVLLPPHEWAAVSRVRPTQAMLSRCITISAEQPSSEFFPWNVELARHAGAVLDINRRAVRSYAEHGIPAEHLQLGYSEAWDRRKKPTERDIDVLFVGRSTRKRERALAQYANVLERFNCHFLLSDNSVPNNCGGVNFAIGEEKLELLGRAKVLLNIHGEDEPYFEWLRMAEAMSCGCAVVTEHSTDLEPLRSGVDLVTGRWEALGLLAAWLVEDGAARSRIVAQADARMHEQAALASGAATLLAAAERVDALPVNPRAATDIMVVNTRIALGTAPPQPPPTEEATHRENGEQQMLRALKRQHQETLSFRRQLAAEALARSRPERPRAETVHISETTAWNDDGAPSVSVIVPLYNDEDVVCEALESVRRSTVSSWEVIVVDDASSDGGPEAVRAWMERHDSVRGAMFRHEVNRGLAAARNTGAARARGGAFLMLDSDNLLRPFGLARLIVALSKDPGAAFSYGILDRFNGEGPVDLISHYGWEPTRLRGGNYIDALALIRRGPFMKLGATPKTRACCSATRTTISGRGSPRRATGLPSCAASSAATGSGTARCSR